MSHSLIKINKARTAICIPPQILMPPSKCITKQHFRGADMVGRSGRPASSCAPLAAAPRCSAALRPDRERNGRGAVRGRSPAGGRPRGVVLIGGQTPGWLEFGPAASEKSQ